MILVFGQGGQVSTELASLRTVHTLGQAQADLADPAACAHQIKDLQPSVVINAAAYTAVDRAEEDEARAALVNGDAPGAMAEACAAMGIPFVHISTDYVFPGTGTQPWQPDDATGPLGAYGRTKLKGENAVRAAGGVHAILRTSWVVSAHGHNFIKTMLRLGETRDALSIVGDQIGGPTPARDLAHACLTVADQLLEAPEKSGTYHFAGAPDTSWADFARAIFTRSGQAVTVTDIPTTDYPTPAQRPLNSRMDCSTTTETFGIERPDWRTGLDTILKDLGAHSHA